MSSLRLIHRGKSGLAIKETQVFFGFIGLMSAQRDRYKQKHLVYRLDLVYILPGLRVLPHAAALGLKGTLVI